MSSLETLLDAAFDAYNQGEFEHAETLARDVLNAEPAHGDALYLLGLIAYRAGALDPAADLLYQAVKLYPDTPSYQLTLASVLQKQGRLDEALSYYDRFPDHPMGRAQAGFIYLLKNQISFAESAFQKALSLQPDLPEAELGLAQCDIQVGGFSDAVARLEKLTDETPLPDALVCLASLYRRLNRTEEALSAVNRGLAITDNASFEVEKGLILEQSGQPEEALKAYRRAVDLDPYRSDVWANLGNVYHKLNDVAKAEDAYKRALQQDLNYPEAHHNLAVLLYEQSRMTEALEHYRAVLSRHPDYLPSLYNLAVIQEENGDEVEALGLYFNVLSRKGMFPDLDWRIANTLTTLFRKGRKEKKQALDFAKGWVKNFPDNPVAVHTYAALSGKKEKASPLAYTRRLYENFAPTYDNLMKQLDAKALSGLIDLMPDGTYRSVLDLGCGTGAFGRAFQAAGRHIKGVDFSPEMLAFADKTGAYDALVEGEISAFLQSDTNTYDLIVAVELLGYLPDIQSFFSLVSNRLNKGGVFAFSVETTDKQHAVLSESGRYLYPLSLVENCLAEAGLSMSDNRSVDLRREGQGFAKGQLIVARWQ